jgi:hypothetical protein
MNPSLKDDLWKERNSPFYDLQGKARKKEEMKSNSKKRKTEEVDLCH